MPATLTATELAAEFAARPGLIPTRIDARTGEIFWRDVDGLHVYRGFFHDGLVEYLALRPEAAGFTSTFGALAELDLSASLPPAGFIFHAGRCGSTLLTKILARSRHNLVYGEALPHHEIWTALPPPPDDLGFYRRLVLAMGRPRLSTYQRHLIKFTSHQIVQFDFIRAAFPGVPALFLFREPAALLESWHRVRPRWLDQQPPFAPPWPDAEAAVTAFFEKAAATEDPQFRVLDYRDLTPARVPSILEFFGVEASAEELRQMLSEFAWDAKSGWVPAAFVPRAPAREPAPPALADLYATLRRRALLDWSM